MSKNKVVILVLVLVVVVYVVVVGGGVWKHRSEGERDEDSCGADAPQPGWLKGGLAKILAPFSPELEVRRLRVQIPPGGGKLANGVLTMSGDQVVIPIPRSDERARRIELALLLGPSVKVLYTARGEDEEDECAQLLADEPLRLAFEEKGGVLKLTRVDSDDSEGSEEGPPRIEFR